jgi:signal transduction histidine kinase/CheY-like chemotaxis protein
MNAKIEKWWDRFCKGGILPDMDNVEKNYIYGFNVYWFISIAGYTFFLTMLLLLQHNAILLLLASNLVMYLLFFTVRYLVARRHQSFLARHLLLLVINAGIFFYDTLIGSKGLVFVYYIPFLFVTISLFSYRAKLATLTAYISLPVALFLFSWLYTMPYANLDWPVVKGPVFGIVNFLLALLLVALFAANIIRGNLGSLYQIERNRLSLQALIDNTHASIWSVDTRYRVIAANRVYKEDMRRIFGVNMHAGFDVRQLFGRENYPEEWQGHYLTVFSGKPFQLEYRFNEEVYELMVAPIFGVHRSIIGAAFYARNISYRKKNELAILEAKEKAEEASRAKAQFLSNISHELRTPLNGIIAITRIMLGEVMADDQRRNMEVLKYSGDHMLSLIDDVLDFNKIDAGKMVIEKAVFNLHHAMEDLVKSFMVHAEEKKIAFEMSLEPDLNQLVTGDITRLVQVMNNLLGNAFKFTSKGKVFFGAAILQRNANSLRVKFSISDTGIGIAAGKIDKIFESFTQADVETTRQFGGTGLGLTISKKLVELMGGNLSVQSEEGVGTTFIIELDFGLAEKQSHVIKEKGINDLKKFAGVNVLLAEDNPVNLLVASTILKKWEMLVTSVDNGQKAIDAMRTGKFDIILMDLEMPVMDGITAVREIRLINPGVPIIAFTAAIYENMQQDLLQKGMTDFVPKPFKPEHLHQCIAAALS